ncbi:tyrosine-type recombinase/integrase [Ensifer aridi]|uniref:tyrosine-type recombinase/integrase n=1 Tax=Ensifer aridi TaxID=1708715 RepID=UPI00358FBAFE
MRGGQAKVLSEPDIRRLLKVASHSRHPLRNKVIVLLSVRAGLRASEIARLDWSMVTDGRGRVGRVIELPGRVVKYGMGRRVPLHAELRAALVALRREAGAFGRSGPVVVSERGGGGDGPSLPMTPKAVVNWFTAACREGGLEGCSSHSGRRTFVTKAARLVQKAGGSLRDVQLLAGHRSIETTQAYIEGDADIQRRLVRMM